MQETIARLRRHGWEPTRSYVYRGQFWKRGPILIVLASNGFVWSINR